MINLNLKDKYLLKSNDQWKSKETWQPLIISIVLVISLAIIHKGYWEATTETNPLISASWDTSSAPISPQSNAMASL